MARRTEQRFIIERELEPGYLRDELIAEFVDLRRAWRFWAAIVWHEWNTRLVLAPWREDYCEVSAEVA